MDRLIGKIKWFSSHRNDGVVTSIGGDQLRFSATDAAEPTPFTVGQLVTYRTREDGTMRPYADDLRAQPE